MEKSCVLVFTITYNKLCPLMVNVNNIVTLDIVESKDYATYLLSLANMEADDYYTITKESYFKLLTTCCNYSTEEYDAVVKYIEDIETKIQIEKL